MDIYKKLKLLGEGLMGKVYLVSKDGDKYAMKVENILSRNDITLQNELKFVNEVAVKYPDQFMQLIEYDIVSDCKEEVPKIPEWMSDVGIQYFKNLRSSGLCVRKIYSLIDNTVSKLSVSKMSMKQRYSMLIQLFYINYLVESNGFVHGDFHHGNIGFNKVNKSKKIKIFDKLIPTYGTQFLAIDYGGLLHKDNLSEERLYQHHDVSDLKHYTEHLIFDKLGLLKSVQSDEDFWNFVNKNKIKMKGMEHDSKLILSQPEISLLKTISDQEPILFELYRVLFTKKFQQLILGDKFKKTIPFINYIPLSDVLFIFKNFNDNKKIIQYLIARLENI